MSVHVDTVRGMDIVRNFPIFLGAAVAVLAFMLNYRVNDRQDRYVKGLLDRAESPDLPPMTRRILIDHSNRTIAWTAARIKYPEQASLIPNVVFLVALLAFYLIVLSPTFISGRAPLWLSLLVLIPILMAGTLMLRKYPRIDADFTRQKLCQLSRGADIAEINPLYSVGQVMRGCLKSKARRDEVFKYSLWTIILREAWLLQFRETHADEATIVNPADAAPDLNDVAKWERLAPEIPARYINRAISSLSH